MPIYQNSNILKAFKGSYAPVNLYKGNAKIAGWKYSELSGEILTAHNTYNDDCSLTINGRSEQTQNVQGKNLLDLKNFNYSNVTYGNFTIANQKVSVNTTQGGLYVKVTRGFVTATSVTVRDSWGDGYVLYPAGTYTISWANKLGTVTGTFYPIVTVSFADGTRINLQWNNVTSAITFTTAVGISNLSIYTGTPSATLTNVSFNLQLEAGSVATTYEAFTPNSPSPDYPSPINSVSSFNLLSTNGGDKTQQINFPYTLLSLPNGVCDQIVIDNTAKTAKYIKKIELVTLPSGTSWNLPSAMPNSMIMSTHLLSGTYLNGTMLLSPENVPSNFDVLFELASPLITGLNYEAVLTYYPQTNIYTQVSNVYPFLNASFRAIES